MHCAVYRSSKKRDTYLYLAAGKDDFSQVPQALLKLLGELVYVMDLELTPERKLAQEDVREVIENLRQQGWHLQLPRNEPPLRAH